MNKNVRAIGFKTIEKNKKALSDIVKNIGHHPDKAFSALRKDGKTTVEHYGYVNDSFGIVLYGTKKSDDNVHTRRWNTFAFSDNIISLRDVSFEKMSNGDVYAYCEDEYTGTELEFRVNNIMDFEKFKAKTGVPLMDEATANIAGLGKVGNIVFPVEKNEDTLKVRAEENIKIRELIKQLRDGDEAAEQKLLDRSLEIASAVRERLKNEDVLSVFEGYCLPYGESDGSYALLGDIQSIESITNALTGETVYNIFLDVTGVEVRLFINKDDLVGLPLVGMRFMGICMLQGNINFF